MKKDKKNKKTFTKVCVKWLLIVAVIDMQLSYVLAFFGNENIAESLSIAVCTEIVGVSIGYFLKSFFETRQEKIQEFEEKVYEDSMLQEVSLEDEEDEE